MRARRIVRVEIALDAEQEMRRDEHRLNRERDALLDRLSVLLRERDGLPQGRDLRGGHGPTVGAARSGRENTVHACRTRRGIADEDTHATRLLTLRREWTDDRHRSDPLV